MDSIFHSFSQKNRSIPRYFSAKSNGFALIHAILQNIVAATNEIDDVSLKRLRGECVKEVTRLKGSLDFDDALDWQKG